ncbi:hypothetical protein [Kribbella italica]|uniref:Uncharacterized protein n=1 Tax=Kribbella italica TaxID=1540520 RepID=A0A7W9J8T4_9ACTN|nr:hypothetical protein [Kribbella italica]
MSTALLIGTTACSSDDKKTSGEAPVAATTNAAASTTPSDLPAAQVVAGLTGAGYKCGRDGDYAICTTGPVAVWVLTGNHKRPPVVSLHSLGTAATATAAIGKVLPQALEIAHVVPAQKITEWFGQQAGKTTAQLTEGDWQVELSVEVDTDEPGAHLSLMDRLCKADCAAE